MEIVDLPFLKVLDLSIANCDKLPEENELHGVNPQGSHEKYPVFPSHEILVGWLKTVSQSDLAKIIIPSKPGILIIPFFAINSPGYFSWLK